MFSCFPWLILPVFKVIYVSVFITIFANQGYTQRISEFNPSNIPPGTEIIYLDENGNVIGNKTLILPDGLDLKFNGEGATTTSEPPSSSDSSHQNGQQSNSKPVQQILSEIPLSLLPKDWSQSSIATEASSQNLPNARQGVVESSNPTPQTPKITNNRKTSARLTQIKFEEIPASILPKDFQESKPPKATTLKPSRDDSPKLSDITSEDIPDSLLPEGWVRSTKSTTQRPSRTNSRNRFLRPTRLQFENVPDSLKPEGFDDSTKPTESTGQKPTGASSRRPYVKPSVFKIDDIPDSLLPKGFPAFTKPEDSVTEKPSPTTNKPQSPIKVEIKFESVPESFLPKGFQESANPTVAPTLKPRQFGRPIQIKYQEVSDSLLPPGFHDSTKPAEVTTKRPSHAPRRNKPVKARNIQFEAVADSLLPKGFRESAKPFETTTEATPRLPETRQIVRKPDNLKFEEIPESLVPPGWRLLKLEKSSDGIELTDQVANGSIKSKSKPEGTAQTNGSDSEKSTLNKNSNRQSRRFGGQKSSPKSDVFVARRRNNGDLGLGEGKVLSDESPGMNKNTLGQGDGAKEPDSVTNSRGRIKSVGVKTTINTSFKIAQQSKAESSTDGKNAVKQSFISRSADDQTHRNNQKPIFNLKDLEIPISMKDFKLNLSSPINVTTGNYTITFFGKPPHLKTEKTDASKSLLPAKKPNDSSNSTENATQTPSPVTAAPPAKSVNESLSTLGVPSTTTKGRLRWPLNRRRKISTARRFLLRTRKPLPTRRTPRPLKPTKSSRPNKWSPRSRAPPRFTTRLSIFKKFQTIPTKPPTTTTTTTEHVYTRKPSSDDTLTSDYIKSSGVIKIEDGVEFTNSLADKNSKEFKTLAFDLKVLLQEVFKNSVWAPVFIRVDIDGFYKGSVVVDFDAVFKRAIANRIKAIHLKKILIDTLNRDGGQLGVYTVNKTSVIFDAFTDLIDPELSTTPSTEEEPVLPQWAIAVIVVSLASLLFVILFSCVACCNKPFAKKRQNDRFLDVGGETEKPPLGGYDNLAIDSFYDLEEWKKPVKQPVHPGRAQKKKRKDRYYDSWKTEWSGYKGPTRPAMSEF